jgi:K+-transporting ATPase ATPase A chain
MTVIGWVQILLYCAILIAIVPPLGAYVTRVFNGERTFLSPILRPVELAIYKIAGVNERNEQHAVTYTIAMLLFHVGGFLILYVLMRVQAGLPFNPADQSAVAPDLSFNTAVSFITNTNWQNYGGESTMSYLAQMLGLTHQNYLSAATGIVLAMALIRGFARHSVRTVGNFWVDVTRCTLYILIPICVPYALFLIWQGMPQTLGAYVDATTLEGAKQTIAVGPVASQIAIKMLGTNGGGFFNANAAHPFENPTALSNYVQMISIFAIGAALTNVFGRMVGNQRQGWAILAVMGILFIAGVVVCYWAEAHGNDALNALGLTGGNLEGKEVRFGIIGSALFAVITTAASCGAVNAMHDSLTAIGGMVPLINIQLGEVIVGGVGAGMYGMLLFVIISIFVAGLMVGRTPEYVGKKIEAKEVKMAMLAILVLPLMYLGWTAVAMLVPSAVAAMGNPGPHGFTEVLYAYVSQDGNNGSAFAGLSANTLFYNLTGAVAMFVGRFWMIIPTMAIAGSLAAKKTVPASVGTFPTTGGLFVGLVVGVRSSSSAASLSSRRWRSARSSSSSRSTPARCIRPIRFGVDLDGNLTSAQEHAGIGAVRFQDCRAGDRLRLRQAQSVDADVQSGDVRARDRHRADDGDLDP